MTGGRRSRLFGGSPNLLLVDENVPGIVLPDIAPEEMPALEQEEDEEQLLLAGSAEDDYAPQSEEEARYQDYVQSGGGLRLFIGNPNAGDIEERVRLPQDVDGPVWDVSSLAAPIPDDDVEVYEHDAEEVAAAQARQTPVLRIRSADEDVFDAPTPPGFQMSFGGPGVDASVESDDDNADSPSGGESLETDGLTAAPSVPPGRITGGDARSGGASGAPLAVDGRLYDAVLDVGYDHPERDEKRPISAADTDFEQAHRDPFGDDAAATHDGPSRDIWSGGDDAGPDDADVPGTSAFDDADTLPPVDGPDDASSAGGEADDGRLLAGAIAAAARQATEAEADDAVGLYPDDRVTDPRARPSALRRLAPWLVLLLVILAGTVALIWVAFQLAPPPETGPPGADATEALDAEPGAPAAEVAPSPPVDPVDEPAVAETGATGTGATGTGAADATAAAPTADDALAAEPSLVGLAPAQSAATAPSSSASAPRAPKPSSRAARSKDATRSASTTRPSRTVAGASSRAAATSAPEQQPETGSTPASTSSRGAPEVTVRELSIAQVLLGTSMRVDEGESVLSASSNVSAVVFVDGHEIGSTPIALHALPSGKHVIKAVSLSSRKVTEVTLDFDPATAKGVTFAF